MILFRHFLRSGLSPMSQSNAESCVYIYLFNLEKDASGVIRRSFNDIIAHPRTPQSCVGVRKRITPKYHQI